MSDKAKKFYSILEKVFFGEIFFIPKVFGLIGFTYH